MPTERANCARMMPSLDTAKPSRHPVATSGESTTGVASQITATRRAVAFMEPFDDHIIHPDPAGVLHHPIPLPPRPRPHQMEAREATEPRPIGDQQPAPLEEQLRPQRLARRPAEDLDAITITMPRLDRRVGAAHPRHDADLDHRIGRDPLVAQPRERLAHIVEVTGRRIRVAAHPHLMDPPPIVAARRARERHAIE
ncbi:MAG: hypothetical protein R3F65_10225 [bacterium]